MLYRWFESLLVFWAVAAAPAPMQTTQPFVFIPTACVLEWNITLWTLEMSKEMCFMGLSTLYSMDTMAERFCILIFWPVVWSSECG